MSISVNNSSNGKNTRAISTNINHQNTGTQVDLENMNDLMQMLDNENLVDSDSNIGSFLTSHRPIKRVSITAGNPRKKPHQYSSWSRV